MSRQIEVRERLPADASLVLGLSVAAFAVHDAAFFGLAWDARAYYTAWDSPMYQHAPGTVGSYLYSPAFAQLLWPLTRLPWPVFAAVFMVAAALGVGWLLAPLGWRVGAGLWLACLPEILSGNVYWLLAIGAVLGLARPEWWSVAALTKLTPTLGPVWWVARGEWARVGRWAVVVVTVSAISYAIAPDLWHSWVSFVVHQGQTRGTVDHVPPVTVRVPVAVLLTVYAARRGTAWLLPVAMLLASPVVGLGSFAVLAGIPRLRHGFQADLARAGAQHGVDRVTPPPSGEAGR